MTIQQFFDKVNDCFAKLSTVSVSDASILGFEILVTQFRIRLLAGVYDPHKQFGYEQRNEIARLNRLTEELERSVARAEIPSEVVMEVASLVKGVLRVEGIPFRA